MLISVQRCAPHTSLGRYPKCFQITNISHMKWNMVGKNPIPLASGEIIWQLSEALIIKQLSDNEMNEQMYPSNCRLVQLPNLKWDKIINVHPI